MINGILLTIFVVMDFADEKFFDEIVGEILKCLGGSGLAGEY